VNDDLARRLESADVNESGLALGELIEQGRGATPVLTRAARSDSADVRKLAMEGLGKIADPASVDDVRRGLEDPDGRVRSLAAVALNRLGEPDALDALLATLDDWPDLTRSDMSRSTYELAAAGPRALPAVIGLLESDSWTTRAKGAWVIRQVASRDEAMHELGEIVSGFDPRNERAEERERVAAAARAWLDERDSR
jgi:HEAT repeat protein